MTVTNETANNKSKEYRKIAMKTKTLFQKFELPLFFLLSYLLSWWTVPFMNGGLFPYGPSFAAVIVVAMIAGKEGLYEFWSQLSNWRAGWWYLVGPAIIIGYQGIAFAINLSLGATIAETSHFPPTGVFLQLLLLGGLWEEIGWTGYALSKLQKYYAKYPNGPVIAVLIVGIFRSLWHLPLFLYGTIYWFDIFIFALAFQIIIAWLYNRSGGSVLAVMLFHFTSNIMGAVTSPIFQDNDRVNYYAVFMGLALVIALVIAWESRFKLGVEDQEGNP